MKNRRRAQSTQWQAEVIRDLKTLATVLPDEFRVLDHAGPDGLGLARARIRLRTSGMACGPGGLALRDYEEFILRIGSNCLSPPLVEVDHNRFLGHPHVLQGRRLCIYLDSAREWDPQQGISRSIDRLRDWLEAAAGGKFKADDALYHAVGGVLHRTPGAPTIVVRESSDSGASRSAFLVQRSAHRYDLRYGSHRADRSSDHHRTVVFDVVDPLPLGAGTRLLDVLNLLDTTIATDGSVVPRPSPRATAFLTALAAAAARNPPSTPQIFLLAIPHPVGGPPHLLAGQIPASAADGLRQLVSKRSDPIITVDTARVGAKIPVEWYAVSDEREGVTTRRDTGSPTSAFFGKVVHIWGCGGLGSWMAEFIARSGAQRIVLCDPGVVTGGLLVRQNFTEADIGETKVEALRRRLTAIRDDIVVEVRDGLTPDDAASLLPDADLLIDASISRAIGQLLDEVAVLGSRPILAQVATDAGSGTLGLLTVSDRTSALGPNAIDQHVGQRIVADGSLEPFHTFWKDVSPEDEIIPTRGCSVPTFHGSAADIAAVAASLTSILGAHLGSSEPVSGTHILGLPHAPNGPLQRFFAAP